MTDRAQNGEAKYAPLPDHDLEPDESNDTVIKKTVDIKFVRQPNGSIVGEAPSINGLPAYNFELQNMTWGLFEDIESMQRVEDSKRMSAMLTFLDTYVVGGPRTVPLEHTKTIFEAITAYASMAMDPSKN